MDNDFSFAKGLTCLNEEFDGYPPTRELLYCVAARLKDYYCLEILSLYITPYGVVNIKIPNTYSEVQKGWIQEVIKYYSPAGMSVYVYRW